VAGSRGQDLTTAHAEVMQSPARRWRL